MTAAAIPGEGTRDGAGWTRDAWLGQRLGVPAWRLDPTVPGWADAMAGVLNRKGFAYARLPTADVGVLGKLLDAGFRVIDTTMTAEREAEGLTPLPKGWVRFAEPGDRHAVRAVARRAFRFSRFHLDPAIAASTADMTRADWIDGYFDGGRGSAMVVAGLPGAEPSGFLLLLGPEKGTLVIDLIAVDESARGQGLATGMIAFAAGRIAGVDRLRVSTQAANIPSLRLYGRMGFLPVSSHYVVHLHHG
ncbi:GNAT family N-acetyltransferase [Azospirillum aestuarii]|uniref:GNAT family N-acetyltransferase n=1 Tax=Azospirillum aestuarii TaxID=2802052 RepID=UPI0040552A93